MNEYLLCRIQRARHSLVPLVGAGYVPLMLSAILPALPHRHTAESLLTLNEIHAVATVCHVSHLQKEIPRHFALGRDRHRLELSDRRGVTYNSMFVLVRR